MQERNKIIKSWNWHMGMHPHFRYQQDGAEAEKKGLWVVLGNKIEVRRIRPFINASLNCGKREESLVCISTDCTVA